MPDRLIRACALCAMLALGGATLHAQQPRSVGSSLLSMTQNYPNPFGQGTTLPFVLGAELPGWDRGVRVDVAVYDLLGRHVAWATTLDHPEGQGMPVRQLRFFEPGPYEVFWDGRARDGASAASGVYVAVVEAGGERVSLKMFRVK